MQNVELNYTIDKNDRLDFTKHLLKVSRRKIEKNLLINLSITLLIVLTTMWPLTIATFTKLDDFGKFIVIFSLVGTSFVLLSYGRFFLRASRSQEKVRNENKINHVFIKIHADKILVKVDEDVMVEFSLQEIAKQEKFKNGVILYTLKKKQNVPFLLVAPNAFTNVTVDNFLNMFPKQSAA